MPSFAGRRHDDGHDGYDEDGDNVFISFACWRHQDDDVYDDQHDEQQAQGGWGHTVTMLMCRHNSMYAASTRSMASPLHQPPYKLQDVSGASEVGMA